ncbi:MAG TPA: hypothetical protein DCM64_12310 [Gammaproteobacteria bacterium]|jgi:hypothetical protein|nr:hypothetical protein [Gammaproteobacteria bacterium]MDP6733509.1 hypothetical protein [Gammaproteobacteria bacterium]HAJ77223.1 hypothetical protein [Gammaproteobacteria bacterium]|tara:strand:- start:95 stop:475 length:381 start_codon:yes stop_codon:yes gene_type:complete
MKDINIWLWIYVIGSIPVLLFYAAGFSGWFFDYPMPLFVIIFLILATPVALLVLKTPSAPAWNIALLWGAAVLLTMRIIWGVQVGDGEIGSREATMLLSFTAGSMLWAGIWTAYFLTSERIARTFS